MLGEVDKPSQPRTRRRGWHSALAGVGAAALALSACGGPAKPPVTGAASVLPASTLAYVHISTDRSRSSVTNGLKLAERFPGFPAVRSLLFSKLGGVGSTVGADFKSGVLPWLGKEVAVAVVGSPTAGPLIVAAVRDAAAAQHYVAGLPHAGSATYQGVTITGHPGSGDTAFVGKYLLVGHSASIKAAIDVVDRHAPALSSDAVYQRASAGEPAGRAVDGYFSVAGLRQLAIPTSGPVGIVGALADQTGLQGLAISLTPASGGVRVHLDAALDSKAHTATSFRPSFTGSAPADAVLFLDGYGLDHTLPRVLDTIGLGARIPPIIARLVRALSAKGVSVNRGLSGLLGREAAVVVTAHNSVPAITVIVRPRDMAATRTVFAQMQAPLAQLLAGGGARSGQAPLFNQVPIEGVAVHQLVVAPTLQFDYASIQNELVMSTNLQGIAAVLGRDSTITGHRDFTTTLGNRPTRVTSLLFLDLSQLLRLNEQIGLVSGRRFRSLAPDLERVHAIGMYTTDGAARSSADLFLRIT